MIRNPSRREWLSLPFLAPALRGAAGRRLNVLLIAVDDLNNRIACYGDRVVKTPNIDRLARMGVRFDRSYCNYPLCNPSRTSLLSGRRPDTTRVFDNTTPPRTYLKDTVFLPEHFRQHGYFTARVGKIAHGAFEHEVKWDISEYASGRAQPDRGQKRQAATSGPARGRESGILEYRMTNNSDGQEPDGRTARRIAELMEQNRNRPFFLGAGFHKPHLPWVAPKKYFDLYKPEMITLPDTPADDLDDIPPVALTLRKEEMEMQEAKRKEFICAYHAATSFMDAQVGVLLDALDRLKLWDSTVVVLFGDHGWHLSEHKGLWRKMTVFEEAARAPLIAYAPGKRSKEACPRLVEFVDIFPTLADLCGLPAPEGLEGRSFAPLLDNPQREWKRGAYTVVEHQKTLGRSVRTDRYRYTEWGGPEVAELYDHEMDPHEYRNLAKDPRQAPNIAQLRRLLHDPKLALPR